MALAGCASEQGLTAEQKLLREQKARWNQTVAVGALVGAAAGAGIGAAAAAASGGNSRDAGIAALVFGAVGLVAGLVEGMKTADRNLKFENQELSALQRVAAAEETTKILNDRAAAAESTTASNRARLDDLDRQFRANEITAIKYRAEAETMRKDLELMQEYAGDARKARTAIVTSGEQVSQLLVEEPKMSAAQRRLEQSAESLQEKLNRVPTT